MVATRRVEEYSLLARRAVRVVRRVLPEWPGGLVVEVPASAAALDAALGVEPGTFGNVAGVTTTVDGTGSSGVPVHVFLNPARIAELRPAGAQVVVSHEAAHVALDATSSQLPAVALGGLRRLHRVARRAAAADDHGRPDHPAGAP